MKNHFEELRICPEILSAINELNFSQPTTVQNKAIPHIFNNKDVIVTSATGSGKTLAYATRLIQNSHRGKGLQAIVLVPTRELAKQVGEVFKQLSKYKPLNIMTSFGGGSLKEQKEQLLDTEILIGTTGRVSDYVEQDLFQLGYVKTIVLDEADLLVENQFLKEVEYILKDTPKRKQTLIFSATIPKEIFKLARQFMKDPKRIAVTPYVNPKNLKQLIYEVEQDKKLSLLTHFLESERSGLSIVFVNRQDTAEFLSKNLKGISVDVKAIHGEMSQGKRNRIIEEFQDEKFDVLISTDIAGRGLDVSNVTHIYNYNIPKDVDKYIHRIGRTARAGASGKVINFVAQNDTQSFIDVMKEHDIRPIRKELPEFEEVEVKKAYKAKKNRR